MASGAIDKRALAVLAYLSRSGLKPTVGTLRCGSYDAVGYVSAGHVGDAVAIVAINGVPIAGHQGAGSITDTTIRTLLTLQGEFTPARIVSLMHYPGAPSTLARADHGDYVELAFAPAPRAGALESPTTAAVAHRGGRRTERIRTDGDRGRAERGAMGTADRAHRGAARTDRRGQAQLRRDPRQPGPHRQIAGRAGRRRRGTPPADRGVQPGRVQRPRPGTRAPASPLCRAREPQPVAPPGASLPRGGPPPGALLGPSVPGVR